MNYKIKKLKPFGALVEPNNRQVPIRDLDVEDMRALFMREQLILLRGFKTFSDADDFSAYCESWGNISLWPFGKVLELKQQDNPADHIFDNSYVPLHWDGMYRQQVPEYQIFHCVKAPARGQGGRTTFSNTILVLNHLSDEFKNTCHRVTGVYRRKMEFYHSSTISPIIMKHPLRDFYVIRYSEPPCDTQGRFVNPPDLEFKGIPSGERLSFFRHLNLALYAPQNFYAHRWEVGDVVIADNFSLLHGREGFTSKSPRQLQRVHVLSHPPVNNPSLESYQ